MSLVLSCKEKGKPLKNKFHRFHGPLPERTCETRGITISKERNRGTSRKGCSADPFTAI